MEFHQCSILNKTVRNNKIAGQIAHSTMWWGEVYKVYSLLGFSGKAVHSAMNAWRIQSFNNERLLLYKYCCIYIHSSEKDIYICNTAV